MSRIKVQLTRNLRKNIMRGHPWIYKEALRVQGGSADSLLAEVSDQKGKFLCWGLYDSSSPLSVRVLSLEKKPPTENYFKSLIGSAIQRREFLKDTDTNAYRLINGEGDRLPGLVCDMYDQYLVIQFDGEGPKKFWSQFPVDEWLRDVISCKGIVNKTRGSYEKVWGQEPLDDVVIEENGIHFSIDIPKGQKTGFFLDQRDNRQYVKSFAAGRSVMNLFSYTGGFSLYAGAGGAEKVLSVDLSKPALEAAEKSWQLNSFRCRHETLAIDIFKYLNESTDLWDMVIVDPPSMAHASGQKAGAMAQYIQVFSQAAQRVEKGGQLMLSSCSSHISFEDFFEIINETLSQSKRRGVIQRVSGQGADHPFPHICPELRYLKFVHIHLE